MHLQIPQARLDDRRSLLSSLDSLRHCADKSGMMALADHYDQQAFDVITGGVAGAFDLSKEDPRTLERDDTSKLFRIQDLHRWGDMARASNLLGKQLLLARRLCEAGCGFVTVSDCGWDYHANGNSPKRMAGIYPMGGQVDHAVSAFLEDLEQRGLSDKILLVVTGEMGRTPRLNNNGGRDHYGKLTSLLLAGGGLKMGQVIGESDRTAAEATTDPYGPEHLMATIMRVLLDVVQFAERGMFRARGPDYRRRAADPRIVLVSLATVSATTLSMRNEKPLAYPDERCPACGGIGLQFGGHVYYPPVLKVAGIAIDLPVGGCFLKRCEACGFQFKFLPIAPSALLECYAKSDAANWGADPGNVDSTLSRMLFYAMHGVEPYSTSDALPAACWTSWAPSGIALASSPPTREAAAQRGIQFLATLDHIDPAPGLT